LTISTHRDCFNNDPVKYSAVRVYTKQILRIYMMFDEWHANRLVFEFINKVFQTT